MRRDLPIGVLVAQTIHAAGESVRSTLRAGTVAVALWVPDELALEAVSRRLAREGVEHVRVVENDGTYQGELMALGVVPGRKEVVGRPMSGIPLVR